MALKDRFRRAVTRSNTAPNDPREKSISPSSSKTASGATTPTNSNGTDGLSPLTSTQTAVDTKSPAISLTKTHSLLGKTMTWGGSSNGNGEPKKTRAEKEKEKQLKQWKKQDEVEWTSPTKQRSGKKDAGCQNTLRAFDFRTAALEGSGGRNKSICSGVSPSGSRNPSIDGGLTLAQINGKRGSAASVDPSKLSQELSRLDIKEEAMDKKTHQPLVGVQE